MGLGHGYDDIGITLGIEVEAVFQVHRQAQRRRRRFAVPRRRLGALRRDGRDFPDRRGLFCGLPALHLLQRVFVLVLFVAVYRRSGGRRLGLRFLYRRRRGLGLLKMFLVRIANRAFLAHAQQFADSRRRSRRKRRRKRLDRRILRRLIRRRLVRRRLARERSPRRGDDCARARGDGGRRRERRLAEGARRFGLRRRSLSLDTGSAGQAHDRPGEHSDNQSARQHRRSRDNRSPAALGLHDVPSGPHPPRAEEREGEANGKSNPIDRLLHGPRSSSENQ